MENGYKEYQLKKLPKASVLLLFVLVGTPICYAGIRNYQIHNPVMAGGALLLLMVWAIAIFSVFRFNITITNDSIRSRALFFSKNISFEEIDTIHFGSTWSNFYVRAENDKIYVSKDYENYGDIIQTIIRKVYEYKDLDEVEISGEAEAVEKFDSELGARYPEDVLPDG